MKSIRSSYVALCKSRIRLLIFGGRCPGGLLTCGPTCQCFTKPIRVPHEAEQRQKQHVVKLKKMREKRIQQWVKRWLLHPSNFFFSIITSSLQLNCGKGAALWFDASLLITTPAPWLGCFTLAALHCIPVWHMDPVAWCPTCRRKGLEDLWKRVLHSYNGGVDDTTAQWTITCTL